MERWKMESDGSLKWYNFIFFLPLFEYSNYLWICKLKKHEKRDSFTLSTVFFSVIKTTKWRGGDNIIFLFLICHHLNVRCCNFYPFKYEYRIKNKINTCTYQSIFVRILLDICANTSTKVMLSNLFHIHII